MTYAKLDLSGRTAVVIGGTSGIGRAIAHGFAEAGADVVATSRRLEQVETAAAEIEALEPPGYFYEVDFGRAGERSVPRVLASGIEDR